MTTQNNGGQQNPGNVADSQNLVKNCFGAELCEKFEIHSYRNAATILKGSYPDHFREITEILAEFKIDTNMIRTPGGNKGPIAKYVDTLFSDGWVESQIQANLTVKLIPANGKGKKPIAEWEREGFLEGHRIDFLKGRIAFDLEWNSKDQTYDRDLYAFRAFYDAGAIDLGIILTRGSTLNNNFFRDLGHVLTKEGNEGKELVVSKFGASTTWMGKLLYRLEAGRNGGCPILAIGITKKCINGL